MAVPKQKSKPKKENMLNMLNMLKEKQPLKNTFMVLLNAKIHFLWFEMIRVSNYNSS